MTVRPTSAGTLLLAALLVSAPAARAYAVHGRASQAQPCAIAADGRLTLIFVYGAGLPGCGDHTDNNGNIREQEIEALVAGQPAFSQTYDYDQVNRLTDTSESGGVGAWSRTNAYDPFGNRTVNVGPAQTISQTTNQIAAVASMAAPGYDPAGNMTFHPQVGTLAYDAENRQTSFLATGKSGAYVYDGEGRRVKRMPTGTGDPVTIYAYDAFGKLAAEYSPTAPNGTGGTFYRTTDHLGSTRIVTEQDGTVCERRDYYPFGERINTSSGDARSEVNGYALSCGFDQRFTAKERDDESGLDYFGARYYASSLGRFTSADAPLVGQSPDAPQSWNLYRYVQNNPLRHIDPDGRCGTDLNCWEEFGSGVADTTYRPIVQAVSHPIDTVSNVVTAIAHPIDTAVAVKDAVVETTNATLSGDPNAIGQVTGTIVSAIVTAGVGKAATSLVRGARAVETTAAVANPVSNTLARVVPAGVRTTTLGPPGAADVFVTNAAEVSGLNAGQIASKLTIPASPTGFQVFEFPTPSTGLASPVFRSNPGFVGGGRTAGGAAEFVIPNGPIPPNAIRRVVP